MTLLDEFGRPLRGSSLVATPEWLIRDTAAAWVRSVAEGAVNDRVVKLRESVGARSRFGGAVVGGTVTAKKPANRIAGSGL